VLYGAQFENKPLQPQFLNISCNYFKSFWGLLSVASKKLKMVRMEKDWSRHHKKVSLRITGPVKIASTSEACVRILLYASMMKSDVTRHTPLTHRVLIHILPTQWWAEKAVVNDV
jgi:hypothetical protein